MRKCPDCAEENMYESLFCKHCGRCLLAPDPELGQRSGVTHTEHHKTHDVIDFLDDHLLKNARVAKLKMKPQAGLSVTGGWLLLLNFLAFILMSAIASNILAR